MPRKSSAFVPAAVLAAMLAASPALADGFAPVSKQSEFVQLIAGKHLTRTGIKLAVSPQGEIKGSAFGIKVTGAWRWKSGYFCRDLYYGKQNLGPNCQVVMVKGDTLRFVSDEGAGDYADLRLR